LVLPEQAVESPIVTRQDVVNAHRLFFGHEPENEAAIAAFMDAPSLEELRDRFLRSPEFQRRSPYWLEHFFPPLELPPARIDTDATPEQWRALLAHTKGEWERLGREEPHWSVLTHDDFKKSNLEAHKSEFFRSGRHILSILETLGHRHGLDPSGYRTCFELGCGVGRLTLQLGQVFPRVIAADISRFHLDICREELQRAGRQNVELLCLSDVDDLKALPPLDVFVSIIVLQHNPPPMIKVLLRTILERLAPKGVAVFQLMTWREGYEFDLQKYLDAPRARGMEMHVIPQPVVFATVAAAGCHVLEVREDSFVASRSNDRISNTFFVRRDAQD